MPRKGCRKAILHVILLWVYRRHLSTLLLPYVGGFARSTCDASSSLLPDSSAFLRTAQQAGTFLCGYCQIAFLLYDCFVNSVAYLLSLL